MLMNVRFEANNGHDADGPRCPLMTQSGHSSFTRQRLETAHEDAGLTPSCAHSSFSPPGTQSGILSRAESRLLGRRVQMDLIFEVLTPAVPPLRGILALTGSQHRPRGRGRLGGQWRVQAPRLVTYGAFAKTLEHRFLECVGHAHPFVGYLNDYLLPAIACFAMHCDAHRPAAMNKSIVEEVMDHVTKIISAAMERDHVRRFNDH